MKRDRPVIKYGASAGPSPCAIEAEKALLGAFLIDPDSMDRVADLLPSSDRFHDQKHAQVFETMRDVRETLGGLDVVMLLEALEGRGVLADIGGTDFLYSLAQTTVASSHARYYAQILDEKWRLRELARIGAEMVHEAHHAPEDSAAQILGRSDERLSELLGAVQSNRPVEVGALAQSAADAAISADGNAGQIFTTGFEDLDDLVVGYQPGDFVVWAARPSMGKTSAMLCCALELARRQMEPVLIVSLEMSKHKIGQRLVSMVSGVPLKAVRSGGVGSVYADRLREAEGKLQTIKFWVIDTPSMTVSQIRAVVRQYNQREGVRVVFIDYLQKIDVAADRSQAKRNEQVAEISSAIKRMARELGVVVVCMAQLNRGPEGREDKRPRMGDLGETGRIEMDADVIVMIHREVYYHQHDSVWMGENPNAYRQAEFIVSKARDGATGISRVEFDPETTKFSPLWKRQSEELPL